MTISQTIRLIPRIVKYNLKVIFAGRFVWFLLAATVFFGFFMFVNAWERGNIDESLIYGILFFPGVLLVFYPAVYGIQNDVDSRMLEIIFGIPDYRYKVWGVRLIITFAGVFIILAVFAGIAAVLMYPVNPLGIAAQIMFPILFLGSLAFMFSTVIRTGNGTAVTVIIIGILLLFITDVSLIRTSVWNIMLNPYETPRDMLQTVWEATIVKNRVFLITGSAVWIMIGLLNLQKREKFVS